MHAHVSGYTLSEILAVVLVLSLAAAVAIPNLSATDPHKLDLAVSEFAEAMRFARAEAIRTGEPHGVRRQSPQNRIRVFSVDQGSAPWSPVYDVRHPISKKLYDVDLDDHPFARVDTMDSRSSWSATCNAISMVWFDAIGVPRCLTPAQSLVLSFETDFTLDGETRTLVLDPVTGRPRVP